jgi:hypothetical protein
MTFFRQLVAFRGAINPCSSRWRVFPPMGARRQRWVHVLLQQAKPIAHRCSDATVGVPFVIFGDTGNSKRFDCLMPEKPKKMRAVQA